MLVIDKPLAHKGKTLLSLAAKKGKIHILNYLIRAGATIDIKYEHKKIVINNNKALFQKSLIDIQKNH